MSSIKIIPFGGVRENGKNMYVAEIEEDIYILDCGLQYPENGLLGIDSVIPDFSYLVENKERIVGVFLTHGHADAIGALPYLLASVEVPVFGSELTVELAKLATTGYPGSKKFTDFHIVNEQTEIDFPTSTVSFFRTTHTIPDSLGIVLGSTEGSIVYTGDFKFDHSAIDMYKTDFGRLAEIGQKGVFALLSDSSNAENPAQLVSEKQIAEEVEDTVKYWDGRIVVAAVASNIQRLQQIFNAAHRANRKVVLTGRNINEVIQVAIRLNKLTLPSDELIIKYQEMKNYQPEELLILETGRHGEPIKSLQRMANQRGRGIQLGEGDLVYITTTPSTAMETEMAKTENLVYRAGATVRTISDNIKVSGHGSPADLQLMINLMKPRYFVPIQGEYRVLAAHADLAHDVGMDYRNIFLTGRGDIIEYDGKRMHMAGSVDAQNVMVDGIGVGDIGNIVLRDRRILSEDGVFIAVTTINRKTRKVVAKPQITTRGFVYVKDNRELVEESAKIVEKIVEEQLVDNDFEWSKLKQEIRDQLSRYLFEQTKRRPVILPVIMESSQRRK
ncbi:ribonuclease J [Vagococcus xieshaowenii]|uniref:Ribonuclease J n=1 Tax=Vagococcus xieshaowenii TaxID=2562451 RepID=A0AAJ5EF85_9ENTE|nr:ribonuclease J [Vagococcus xieshaowenii]QCA27951.1 ribonuclease J [Vagococcus xieshaowenii]TFZ41281.1 ribonuclease J [Vagococcus xieshaowenii]